LQVAWLVTREIRRDQLQLESLISKKELQSRVAQSELLICHYE